MTSCIGKAIRRPHSKVEGLLIKKINAIAKEMYPEVDADFYVDAKTGDIICDALSKEQIEEIGRKLGQ